MTYFLYADAKPSETIKKQRDSPSGLSVACILPFKHDERILNVPIKQYKDYDTKQKEQKARKLINWLSVKRSNGLIITGFLLSRSLNAAARYGLNMIEELPNTHVVKHYESYRLSFGEETIDFAQAVALMYYYLPVAFGCLRSWTTMNKDDRNLVVFLDRFPGSNIGDKKFSANIPKTQGMKFFEFIRQNSETAKGIDRAEKLKGVNCVYTNLDYWRSSPHITFQKGKDHPHFILTDWLVAGALANSFKDEFTNVYPNAKTAVKTVHALIDLYNEFKNFDIWEVADDQTMSFIRPATKVWSIPDDARSYIMKSIK